MTEIPKRPAQGTNESALYYTTLMARHEHAVAVAAVEALRELSVDPLGRVLTTQRVARQTLKRIDDSGWTP